ncbi:MAG TPA: protein kinase [Gemmatimonadaceae bacterium]|nr:protein kinase [Gemmatimonadaceae bacterium]
MEHSGAPRTLAGRYTVRRELGRGGMAVVVLADDLKHEREVAIKLLLPDVSAAVGAERFTREIKVVARLQHPHILPLYDSGYDEDRLFFVMPFVEGESLRQRLTGTGALSLIQTTRIARQIADALDYAHNRGIVHRDLKPENVLMNGEQALLADFGIARVLGTGDQKATEALTVAGLTVGTPHYMSPEQAAGDGTLDGRSDVYSLGCVCYELLSGHPPFHDTSTWRLMNAHLVEKPAPLSDVVHAIPAGVSSAIARALAKDPAERFDTAGDFVTALEQAMVEARAPTLADVNLNAAEAAAARRRTVLVLDFTNISGAADADWLSSGIAETLSVDLKRITALRVVGSDAPTRQRLEALRRTGGTLDAARAIEIARSVGATWVVWGGYQKAGERVRLTPHFADVVSGEVTTPEKIDGKLEDIFALQDRIVTSLTDLLRIQLSADERAMIEQPETTHLSAYEYYAKGLRAFNLFGMKSSSEADACFRKAIAIDPNYALAHVGLGSLLMPKYIASGRREDLDEGVASLTRAMELDPSNGEPYVFLAYMYLRQYRYEEAIAAARESILREPSGYFGYYLLGISYASWAFSTGELAQLPNSIRPLLRSRATNPAFHPAHMGLGEIYTMRGLHGHAIQVLDEAVKIEKANTGFIFLGALVQRALVHFHSGEDDAAWPLIRLALERYPGSDHVYADTMNAAAHFAAGCLHERAGELVEARRAFEAGIALAEERDHRLGIGAHWVKCRCGIARILARSGDLAGAGRMLAEAQAMHRTRSRFVWGWILIASDCAAHYEIASTLALLGRTEDALAELEDAVRLGWANRQQLAHDPSFHGMGDHERLRRLLMDATTRVTLAPPVGTGGLP